MAAVLSSSVISKQWDPDEGQSPCAIDPLYLVDKKYRRPS